MTESINIYDKYNINLSRLSRDYIKFPLKKIGNRYEYPIKEDMEYLYLELNLTRYELCEYFKVCDFTINIWIKLYNLIKPTKQIVERREKTSLKKYGRSNYFKGEEGKKAVQEANIKKYGVSYTNNENWKKKKQKENYKLKTGYDNPSQNPEIKKKKEETSLKHFGVKYHTQTEEYKNRMRKCMIDRLNDMNGLISISKSEKMWLDSIGVINDQCHRQVPFITTNFVNFVDGYDPKTNTIYEFLGDYWHGNPEIFNPNDLNTCCGKTFKMLNEHTVERFNKIKKEYDVKIIYIWENDFIKNNKIKKDWREKMHEY